MRKMIGVGVVLAVMAALGAAYPQAPGGAPAPRTPRGLPPVAQAVMKTIDPEKIRAHVRFLAHDLLEGRGTGQRGGDIAAEYMATEFALDGLKPAGDNGA